MPENGKTNPGGLFYLSNKEIATKNNMYTIIIISVTVFQIGVSFGIRKANKENNNTTCSILLKGKSKHEKI